MNVVLLEPEIPQNTGNIARTCAVTDSKLHLIRPMGFAISDKHLKRAGMDYWYDLDICYYDSYMDFLETAKPAHILFASTKAKKRYTDVSYGMETYVMFGKESAGIPESILSDNMGNCIRVPMNEKFRSLNLASSAAIIVYEAMRQLDFAGLKSEGELHLL